MSTPYDAQVQAFVRALRAPATGPLVPPSRPALAPDAPLCLVFSPHPDDEALVGGLALRLRSEAGWRVVNVAVTLGSRLERRAARWQEAQACCDHLGFELFSVMGVPGQALERITPEAARTDPVHWRQAVQRVAALIERHQPRLIVCPHELDGHGAHMGTHLLVRDALEQARTGALHLLLSEYWNTQLEPGLMLELNAAQVAQLMAATALHVGEVERNPYHLSLPAFLIDGARRGAERVGPPGAQATPAVFAALYGWLYREGGAWRPVAPRLALAGVDLNELFL